MAYRSYGFASRRPATYRSGYSRTKYNTSGYSAPARRRYNKRPGGARRTPMAYKYSKKRTTARYKKSTDPSEVAVTFQSTDPNTGSIRPDCVYTGGLRVRLTLITHPEVLFNDTSFSGKAVFKRIANHISYELDGPEPCVHRRILFKSSKSFTIAGLNQLSRTSTTAIFNRPVARSAEHNTTWEALSLLFGECSVRDVLYKKVSSKLVTVIEDKKILLAGHEKGYRTTRGFKNALGATKNGVVLKYALDEDTAAPTKCLEEGQQFIMIADIFQVGTSGLDLMLPNALTAEQSKNVTPATSRSSSSGSAGSKNSNGKRFMDEEGSGSGLKVEEELDQMHIDPPPRKVQDPRWMAMEKYEDEEGGTTMKVMDTMNVYYKCI